MVASRIPIVRIDCPVEGCAGLLVWRLGWDQGELGALELHEQTCDCAVSEGQLSDSFAEADATARCGGWIDWLETTEPVVAGVED